MNKRYSTFQPTEKSIWIRAWLLSVILFAVGSVLACIFVSILDKETNSILFSYLTDYFSLVTSETGKLPSLFENVWESFRWPFLLVILGSTMLGTFIAPLIISLRSFLLSYAVSVFVRFFGLRGFFLSLIIFGIPALNSVIALFIVSLNLFYIKNSKKGDTPHRITLLNIVFVPILLFLGALLHHWLAPQLLNLLVG